MQKNIRMFQPEFETGAFQTTYKDFEKLIDKLKENIKNHKYDVVIGDDCSARLVTLVVSELIKKIYKKDGAIPPKTLFIAGNRREYQTEEYMEKLNKYLDYLIDQGEIKKNAKVLFVSEFLSSGKSASNVIGALIGKGFDVDFGLLSAITHEEKVVERLKENLPKENLYLGTDFNRDGLDAFYDKSPIQGVWKASGAILVNSNESNTGQKVLARKDVDAMVKHLEELYNKSIEQ